MPRRAPLLLLLLAYFALATLYALFTPDWQAPDEPAHYNYVRYLAEEHRFPLLKPGDFPAAYLEEMLTDSVGDASEIAAGGHPKIEGLVDDLREQFAGLCRVREVLFRHPLIL